ncbi:NUDIX hydrolase [Cellulomonas sp. ATA003]|uniref:NUDIX hydrolase n=1 Tax=Cellulomonas sp. ATA003 TaxID=3073064 RepID=UPI0028739E6F|nr:NUDIX hydrolase [Cellulomonas sp. ATA003]WNB86686.1 NUDIX hydrolase [Cellulomonas sp. ATA003]
MTEAEKFASPRVAAGVLFRDDDGRVLLVKPSYKDGWEIPGGYVETGESPRAAAIREVREELGIELGVTDLSVTDWAPHPDEGDKILFIFHGRTVDQRDLDRFELDHTEVIDAKFFPVEELASVMPDRLARRVVEATRQRAATYLEHGSPVPASVETQPRG